MATVAQALLDARRAGIDRLDAHTLLAAVLGRPRTWLLAHDEAEVQATALARFESLLTRRGAGEPLAYLLGEKEFFGLMLHVTPDVLVPRPETETLVEWALELLPADAPARVADLGTGSGAIALALASQRPQALVTAVEASAPALAVAKANGERLGLAVRWLPGDWCAPLGQEHFDLIVANPPYVAEGDPHLEALRHEPQCALTTSEDGVGAFRQIVSQAPARLRRGGWLLLEHGLDQAPAVAALLTAAGLSEVGMRRDVGGRPRCTGARRAA